MKRRAGATSATNLSRDELRVLSRVDLKHPVAIRQASGQLTEECSVTITPEMISFAPANGTDRLEVGIPSIAEPVLDHTSGGLKLEGVDIEVFSHDHATKSALRRIILAMTEMHEESTAGILSGSGPRSILGSAARSSSAPFSTSPTRQTASGTAAAVPPASQPHSSNHASNPPASHCRASPHPPAVLGDISNRTRSNVHTTNHHPPHDPKSGIFSQCSSVGPSASHTGSRRLSDARERPGIVAASGGISRSTVGSGSTPRRASDALPPCQQPRSNVAGAPQNAVDDGPLPRHVSSPRQSVDSDFQEAGSPRDPPVVLRADAKPGPNMLGGRNLVVDTADDGSDAPPGPATGRSTAASPAATASEGRRTPSGPHRVKQRVPSPSQTRVSTTKAKPKFFQPYPPLDLKNLAKQVVNARLCPPNKSPFNQLCPKVGPVKVVDLVNEPASERGKLLMLLGKPAADSEETAVAVYNGHPEVELFVETWAGPGMASAAGVSKTLHAQYSAEVFTMVVHPGETREFVSGFFEGPPQPGWRTQPLSEATFAKRRKDREHRVYEDYQRLQRLVDPEDTELKVLETAVQKAAPFVDLWFLPQHSSLIKPHEKDRMPPAEDDLASEVDAWGRPGAALPPGQTGKLFCTAPVPNDIDMGVLGHAWFACCLAALAEFPHGGQRYNPIKGIFGKQRQEYSDIGAYRCILSKDGWWRDVVVDDYTPLVRYPKRSVLDVPAFCHNIANSRELWAALVEKAYARLCGSYAAVATGLVQEGLQDLTGFPTARIPWPEPKAEPPQARDPSGLFDDLLRYEQQGKLVLLHTPNLPASADGGDGGDPNETSQEKTYEQNGLLMGHAYTVLQVFESRGHRLLRLRNAWPGLEHSWGGRWADGSAKWTDCPEVAADVGWAGGADGTIWLAWPEVLDWFNGATLCHVVPEAGEVRVALPFQPGRPSFVMHLTVKTPAKVYLGVHLKDQRMQPSPAPNGCINVTILQNSERREEHQPHWQRVEEDYEWGGKDYLGIFEFVPEAEYMICVHDYDGGPDGGRIMDDVVVSLHYLPLEANGPSVEGTLSLKAASPVIEAIQFNPVYIKDPLVPVEAFVQIRRHIASKPAPTQHQLVSSVQL
ncbi:Calpain-D [Diplonema papillatum]|nr:Calpain-D [Diplonema papillatum]